MNYKLELAYDGSAFFGYQRQNDARTVQGEIEKVLTIICKEEIRVASSGRTDRGVHALKQVINFQSEVDIAPNKLKYALNRMLPDDISVLDANIVDGSFHARFSAKKKKYRYIITTEDDLFKRKYKYYIREELDIELMKKESAYLIGEHDFFSFSNKRSTDKNTIRAIYDIDIYKNNEDIYIDITANSFLYNMVRIIVMYLINIALGKVERGKTNYLLNNKSRVLTKEKAPASGLYLIDVYYHLL